jgi:hypothetical protein
VGQVREERLGPCNGEDEVILPPHNQGRELPLPKRSLEGGVKLQVGPVVVEQVKLDLVMPRQCQKVVVQIPVIRRDFLHVLGSRHILVARDIKREQSKNRLRILRRRVLPVPAPKQTKKTEDHQQALRAHDIPSFRNVHPRYIIHQLVWDHVRMVYTSHKGNEDLRWNQQARSVFENVHTGYMIPRPCTQGVHLSHWERVQRG